MIRTDIEEKIPRLKETKNFLYWRLKAGLKPIDKKPVKTGVANVYPDDAVERILAVMPKKGK